MNDVKVLLLDLFFFFLQLIGSTEIQESSFVGATFSENGNVVLFIVCVLFSSSSVAEASILKFEPTDLLSSLS